MMLLLGMKNTFRRKNILDEIILEVQKDLAGELSGVQLEKLVQVLRKHLSGIVDAAVSENEKKYRRTGWKRKSRIWSRFVERVVKTDDRGFWQGLHSNKPEIYEAILFDISKWSRTA